LGQNEDLPLIGQEESSAKEAQNKKKFIMSRAA
jgi:hypothetical protein